MIKVGQVLEYGLSERIMNRALFATCLVVVAISTTAARPSGGPRFCDRDRLPYAEQEASTPEAEFRSRDAAIESEFVDAVRQKRNGHLSIKQYSATVRKLHKRELKLFSDVKKYEFQDITEETYWYRGRMKFPSVLTAEAQWLKARKGPAPSDSLELDR